jgi:hypothetical protein
MSRSAPRRPLYDEQVFDNLAPQHDRTPDLRRGKIVIHRWEKSGLPIPPNSRKWAYGA